MRIQRGLVVATLALFLFPILAPGSGWIDSQEHGGIAYFAFSSPPRLERYDLFFETWLPAIALPEAPTAFTADEDGLYVSFGRRTSRFSLEASGEVHLRNTIADVQTLFTIGDALYLHHSGSHLTSIDKFAGTFIDEADHFYSTRGLSIAPSLGKLFARSVGVSPSDIMQVVLNADGTIGAQDDSPYHGDYPNARKTFVLPNEARVADNAGIIYNTSDLTYSNSLAGAFDDLAFYGDLPIVLRDGTLVAYSNVFLETGSYTPPVPPERIHMRDSSIFAFSTIASPPEVEVAIVDVELLSPDVPGEPVDPTRLAYEPDAAFLGDDETVYLLSASYLSVFRWSVPQRSYLETIPLTAAPSHMTYSADSNRLYLAYASGKITKIDLVPPYLEEPFVNSPQVPYGLAAAGEYLFVCDPSGAWESHFTYNQEGVLLSQEDWNYFSTEYIWNEANRKMYFFRDHISPNDLFWEDIGIDGVIGRKMDSPYHSSEGILHPIRVAPDGSAVVLGSGRIYDALSLELVNSLSNNIHDATWSEGILYTVRRLAAGFQVQKWGTNGYPLVATKNESGAPIRLFSVAEGLVVIGADGGIPYFRLLDSDLNDIREPADVNGDGKINAIDLQFVVNGVLGLDARGADCDINDDGLVDSVDIQIVINYCLGIYG